jgi:hypothetical protein
MMQRDADSMLSIKGGAGMRFCGGLAAIAPAEWSRSETVVPRKSLGRFARIPLEVHAPGVAGWSWLCRFFPTGLY